MSCPVHYFHFFLAPHAVEDLQFFILDDDTLMIQFYVPSVSTGIIRYFTIASNRMLYARHLGPRIIRRYHIRGFGKNYTKRGLHLTHTIFRLEPLFTHRFTVFGTTSAGDGEMVQRLVSTTNSSSPTNVTVSDMTARSVTITWDPPSEEVLRHAIRYFVPYFPHNNLTDIKMVPVALSRGMFEISTLTQRTSYTIYVAVEAFVRGRAAYARGLIESTPITIRTG